jgi:Flp pilus assembly protein CpaB
MRRLFLILGAVLGVIVAIGIFLFIQSARPTLVDVPVAVSDIPAGTTLNSGLFRVTSLANIDRATASKWILLSDWKQADGKTTTSEIRAGFPIARSQIDPNSSVAYETRLSLILTGTNDYYFVLPTGVNEVGNFLQPGDRIDLILNVTNALMRPISQTAGASTDSAITPSIPLLSTVMPPISKLVMQNMSIMRIDRDKGSGGGQADPNAPPPLGNIQRLYIKVDRDQLEVLSFVLNNGKHNIAVRAANGSQDTLPTSGVTWDDFARWFYAQRGDPIDAVQPFNVATPMPAAPITPTP